MAHSYADGRSRNETHFSIERKNRGGQRPKPGEPHRRAATGTAGSPSTSGSRTFVVRCEPHDQRYALIAASGFSLFVGQRIRRRNLEQMWDSVVIHCDELLDGTLAVRVLVSDPDWDELLQIARIRSRPDDRGSQTALGCNLDHVSKSRTPYWLQTPD